MRTTKIYEDKLPFDDQRFVEKIAKEAYETPAKEKGLAIHFEAIEVLRAKGYSYRDVAQWFCERGIKVNHVDVWKAHKNGLEVESVIGLAKADPEWAEHYTKEEKGNSTSFTEKEYDSDGKLIQQPPASQAATLGKSHQRSPKTRHSAKIK